MRHARTTDGQDRRGGWGFRLPLSLYGLCAASLVGVCLYFFLSYVPGQRTKAIKRCRAELELRAATRKASLDNWVAGGIADAQTLASSPALLASVAIDDGASTKGRVAVTLAQARDLVKRFVKIGSYDRVVLLDDDLRVVMQVGDEGRLEPAVLRAGAEVLARENSAVSFQRRADGNVDVVFLTRVRTDGARSAGDEGNPTSGVVLLEIDPSRWLYPYLAVPPLAMASAETVLMRREGDDIVFLSPLRHDPAAPLTLRRPVSTPGFAAVAAVEKHEGFGAYVDYRNEPVFAVAVRLKRAPWGIVVKVDQKEALADYRRNVRHAGTSAALSLLAIWAMAAMVVLGWRRKTEQRFEAEHSLLRAMINRPDDVIVFSLDANYCYTAFNEKHRLEMKKVWNADIRVGMNMLDCMGAPELRNVAKLSMDRALHGESFWEEQHQPDLDIYYEFSWNPVLLDKKIIGVAAFVRNITERKRTEAAMAKTNVELERRVAERTAELQVSNQELESFAYAVSHDLRAPLRGIDGWSQAALEDYGPQLEERGRTYLKTVRGEVQRMAGLIDDLLDLSRVTRAPLKRETVDLTAMVKELEAGLRVGQPERTVDFVVEPGMTVQGDPVLLRAVLQNLLGNAWKFTGKRPRARIEVGCASESGQTVYYVRDDGTGFDMRYASKLFAPFQRLHTQTEFPGTGIGLATVQRIIHRHGGKVWTAAGVEQGATFYFTLMA